MSVTIPTPLLDRLRAAKALVVLTGAGISAESGIPTFRGPDGWWKSHRPEELATAAAFERDPHLVQSWYAHRYTTVQDCAPNAGHEALVQLEDLLPSVTVITQNVDGLHQRAGSSRVLEVHGSIARARCYTCDRPLPAHLLTETTPETPAQCPHCNGLVRPAVVWFGESLPSDVLQGAQEAVLEAEICLSVGTSGVVYPAAGLPALAQRHGAFTAEVNPSRTPLSNDMDLVLQGPAGTVLPALTDALTTHLA